MRKMRPSTKKICLTCKKEFKVYACEYERRKTCSLKCGIIQSIGPHGYWIGRKRPELKNTDAVKTMFKPGGWTFKGNRYEYDKLHREIKKVLGKPNICVLCKTHEGLLEWANKSHEYKDDPSDWLSLCRKCHWYYDHKGVMSYGSNKTS